MSRSFSGVGLALSLLLWSASLSCLFFHGQRYSDFSLRTPLENRDVLVLGFLGGREPWDSRTSSVRRLALKLRSMNLPHLHVETVENRKRELALELIRWAFDRNRDGRLADVEKRAAKLVLYGQSFGGAAVIKLARELQDQEIPVLLTIQVDSVGIDDEVVPDNVRRAVNLYQDEGLIIRGEARIRAEDPQKTEIIDNIDFDYSGKKIDLSRVPWYKKLFRAAHTKMNYDPEVWATVEKYILEEVGNPEAAPSP